MCARTVASYLAADGAHGNLWSLCHHEGQSQADCSSQATPRDHCHLLPVHRVADVCEDGHQTTNHHQPVGVQVRGEGEWVEQLTHLNTECAGTVRTLPQGEAQCTWCTIPASAWCRYPRQMRGGLLWPSVNNSIDTCSKTNSLHISRGATQTLLQGPLGVHIISYATHTMYLCQHWEPS